MSLPQEEEEREELGVDVSPCWMVKRSLWFSTMDPAITLTLGAGTSGFLLLALPSISHKGN